MRLSSSALIGLGLVAASLCGCNRARLEFPEEAVGHSWFPAPNARHGVEIVENPHRGVQEVWYRHLTRPDRDALIDELHAPGSLLWSPSSRRLAVNHRDYGSLHDVLIFRLERQRAIEIRGRLEGARDLWQRLHPESMARISYHAARWSLDSEELLVLVVGEPEGSPGRLVRQGVWVNVDEGVVRLADVPPELWETGSPFAR